MAGNLSSGSDDDLPAIAGINITPFVDVVLVLLVIFMVTAPMLVREQMNVNLPKAEMGERSASESLSIVIDRTGIVTVFGQMVTLEQLEQRVREVVSKNPNEQAVISADQ